MPMHIPGMLTAKELANRWGVSVGTVYNRRLRGDPMPPSQRVCSTLRFREVDVIAFEEEHFADSTTASGRAQLREADAVLLEIQDRTGRKKRS